MTGIVKTDQIQGAGSSTVTIPSGTALNVTTVSGTPTFSGDVTLPSINGGQIGGRRNIVINGAMQVAQRGTSSTGLGDGASYPTVDRFEVSGGSSAGRLTMTQDSSAPSGFANSIKLDCTTADTSIAAGEYLLLQQKIEGQDLQQLKKGTSDAEKVTVSFYVKGNASATYVLELADEDNNRKNTQKFNVTTDWTRVVLTYDGDTTGTLDDDNANSLVLTIWLHAGSTYSGGTFTSNVWSAMASANRAVGITSFFDSTDRTFFITGLQMEVGEQATAFEHRSFGEELKLCQRYFIKDTTEYHVFLNHATDSGSRAANFFFPTTMRAQPSMTANPNAGSITFTSRTTGGVGYTVGGSVNNSTKLNDGYVADAEL